MKYILIVLLSLSLSGCCGWCRENCEPKIVTTTKYVYTPIIPRPDPPEYRNFYDEPLWTNRNMRSLLYNINYDKEYIKNLIDLIDYYEDANIKKENKEKSTTDHQ